MPARFRIVMAAVVLAVASACSGSGSGAEHGSTSTPSAGPTTTRPAPGSADALAVTDHTITTPDGRTRTYRVVAPRDHAGGPAPLLLALHGGIGSGKQFENGSGFDELAARDGIVVVYPDGIEIGGTSVLARGHVWNGGHCCATAARDDVDDVGFLTAVIDRVEQDRAIDPDRVYVTGHSNGAIMAYRLACERADRIAAIGIQAGTVEVDECRPSRPVSVLAIHGTADTNIPIDGGRGTGFAGIAFSSPTAAVQTFATADGCGASSTATDPDNPDVATETWTGCRAGSVVEFVRVTGANHAWMGHPVTRIQEQLVGTPYLNFDSTAAIWHFLAAHPRT